ncbi:MAG: hypothetical protein OEY89_13265, partial [Gammaproteobacteria bacterium]|nr:hypothetical protein [Gammaproteobacteria bacterium]
MKEILEIRDGCNTPSQLLRSLAFARFLKIYKTEFIADLQQRTGKQQQEAQPKINFINNVDIRDLIHILESNASERAISLERARELVKFMDGAFHHYRGAGYSRLVRLQNEV